MVLVEMRNSYVVFSDRCSEISRCVSICGRVMCSIMVQLLVFSVCVLISSLVGMVWLVCLRFCVSKGVMLMMINIILDNLFSFMMMKRIGRIVSGGIIEIMVSSGENFVCSIGKMLLVMFSISLVMVVMFRFSSMCCRLVRVLFQNRQLLVCGFFMKVM